MCNVVMDITKRINYNKVKDTILEEWEKTNCTH